jgi:hypothetical protein
MKKLAFLVVVLLASYAGFRWGAAVFPTVERALGISPSVPALDGPQPSPELADLTLDRFEQFRLGKGGDQLSLGSLELSSVLRYALPGIIPPGVDEPAVKLEDGRVYLTARVAIEAFPKLPRLDQIIGLLPDTIVIEMRGSLVPLDQAHLSFLVDRLSASKIPIPSRLVSEVLSGLGREGPPSLPKNALLVPLPDGVQSVFVQADSLVLIAEVTAEADRGGIP